MSLAELRKGSCLAKDGFFSWWEAAGKPPIVIMTDPPYLGVGEIATAKRVAGKRTGPGRLQYGALSPALIRCISRMVAVSEYAIVFGTPESTGVRRDAIRAVGGIYCGMGLIKQTRGAPRLVGDAPSVRHLAAIMGRKKGRAKWQGRAWAEWSETRPGSATRRPIQGTRGLEVLVAMIRDMKKTAEHRTGRAPIVVDPCAGTGTTLIAARVVGLDSIGWERDPKTYAYARRVIEGKGFEVPGQMDLQTTIGGAA